MKDHIIFNLVQTLIANGVTDTKKAASLIAARMRNDNENIRKQLELSTHSRKPNRVLDAPRNYQFLIFMKNYLLQVENEPTRHKNSIDK